MRQVIIQGKPPQDWIDEAEQVTTALRAAVDEATRKAIINDNKILWRDDRIRNWLLKQFANKCWYTEAYESVSSIHVDHYRPKGRTTDLEGTKCEGYWWLAFFPGLSLLIVVLAFDMIGENLGKLMDPKNAHE